MDVKMLEYKGKLLTIKRPESLFIRRPRHRPLYYSREGNKTGYPISSCNSRVLKKKKFIDRREGFKFLFVNFHSFFGITFTAMHIID